MARAMGNNVTVISDKMARAAKVCGGSRMVSKGQRPGLLSPAKAFWPSSEKGG